VVFDNKERKKERNNERKIDCCSCSEKESKYKNDKNGAFD
jgi:hypothetical protein